MDILADSNILLRLSHAADPQNVLAIGAIKKLLAANENLWIVPQNLYEYWSVATRPTSANGLGLPVVQVQNEIARLRTFLQMLDEGPDFFIEWEKLVSMHSVVGKKVHDTRLVAAMIVHGITHLLTFNH